LWSGSANNIPSGWYLCNGGNSTPDLRSKFVIAASGVGSGGYQVGAQGGSASGTTSLDGAATNHGGGYVHGGTGAREQHSHDYDNLPPYYALCYIMKG
jgi:hypothetical protein